MNKQILSIVTLVLFYGSTSFCSAMRRGILNPAQPMGILCALTPTQEMLLYVHQQQEEKKRQEELRAAEVKQLAQIQATLADVQRQQKEQSEKMDKLVAGNAQFIQFLVMMDSAITSEKDIRARLEAAKQLLESDLVDEQQKVLLLNNKIKELKEKAETVAVENAELRAQMQAELEAIQVQLKERMLSMM